MIWLPEIKYAKVWDVEQKEKFTKAKVQTSEKKQDGTYEQSGWFVSFVGKCWPLAKELSNGDTITIHKAKLTNVYDKAAKKSYLNFTVFDFEITQSKAQKPAQSFDDDFANDFRAIEDDSDVPW